MGMAALAAVSCNVDSVDNPSGKSLSFNVVIEDAPGLKSGDLELRSETGEIPLVLQRVVDTKSVQINNEATFVTEYNGNFEVEGNEGGNNVFHANAIYNATTRLWDLQDSDYEWLPGHMLEVVALASEFDATETSNFFQGINYGGTPSTAGFYYTLPEVPNQKDLLVGYFKGKPTTGIVSLKFNHPLTSVQFKVGDLPEGATLTVNSISLVGLDETAHCAVNFGNPSTYAWDNYSDNITYTKTFDNPQALEPGDVLVDGDATFIVIPRKFPHNSQARIVVNVTEYNRTYDVSASLADQEWKAGETNVYSIAYQGSRQAVLTNGPDVNQAMKTLAGGASRIRHIVFEVESDIVTETQVEAATQWPIYLQWEASTGTMTIATSDITIHTGANASGLFKGLTALQDITNLPLLNTKNCVDMSSMFESCTALQNVDLSGFNTEKVTNMAMMFAYLHGMTSLDLSSFRTDNVRGIGGMFRGNDNSHNTLQTINFGENFQLPKNRSFAFTFAYTNLTGAMDLSVFECEEIRDLEYMFAGSNRITSVDLSGFKENATIKFAPCVFAGTSVNAINFGPDITFAGLVATGGATQDFFPRRTIVVTCNEAAERKLKTFGNGNYSGITYQRPTTD